MKDNSEKDFLMRFLENPPMAPEEMANLVFYTGAAFIFGGGALQAYFLRKKRKMQKEPVRPDGEGELPGRRGTLVAVTLVVGFLLFALSVFIKIYHDIPLVKGLGSNQSLQPTHTSRG